MKIRNYIIPIFVPHIGCPNDCVFCNQRKITGISTDVTAEDVKEKIEDYLGTIPAENRVLEVAFFGGSFTGIDTEVQKTLLDVAYSYKKAGIVNKIRLSTRPDYIDDQRLDILEERGVDIIELGVQSMNPEVLKKSNRGHSREDVVAAADLIKERGFTLGLQMMLGLPGDNRETALETASALIALAPKIVRIYPTLVIKETELERDYLSGSYAPISLDEAVGISKILVYLFEKNGINVIRVGLQPSDNISEGGDIVAGPFHPSFRQLVEDEIYYDILKVSLGEMDPLELDGKTLTVESNPQLVSYMAGQNKRNKNRLKEEFRLKDIRISAKRHLDETIVLKTDSCERAVSIGQAQDRLYGMYLEILGQVVKKCI